MIRFQGISSGADSSVPLGISNTNPISSTVEMIGGGSEASSESTESWSSMFFDRLELSRRRDIFLYEY